VIALDLYCRRGHVRSLTTIFVLGPKRVRVGTVENHGNTEITQAMIFVKCCDFAKMLCLLRFYKNFPFLVIMSWNILCDFNTKIFTFATTTKVCMLWIITYWLNMWSWCHGSGGVIFLWWNQQPAGSAAIERTSTTSLGMAWQFVWHNGCKRLHIHSLMVSVSSLTRIEELVGYYNNNNHDVIIEIMYFNVPQRQNLYRWKLCTTCNDRRKC